jgi:hypothetical protein
MQIFLPSSELFHFEPPIARGFNWPVIVVLTLNFGIWALAIIATWRFFHG